MAAATKKPGPVKGPAGVELQRGDTVRVNGRKGSITGFTRDGDHVYVRFVEEGEGPIAGKFPRLEVEALLVRDGRPVEVDLVEMAVEEPDDDGSRSRSLVLTLRLGSSNLVRAAERLVDPGDEAAQAAIFISGCMDELSRAIELRLLSLDEALR